MMHILKDELIYNGDVIKLHKITSFFSDMSTGINSCELSSYRDESENFPLLKRTYHYTHMDGGDHMTEAYSHIMSLPEWKDAVLVE